MLHTSGLNTKGDRCSRGCHPSHSWVQDLTVGSGDRVLPKSLSRDPCARGESRVHSGISLESAVESIESESDYIPPKTDFYP